MAYIVAYSLHQRSVVPKLGFQMLQGHKLILRGCKVITGGLEKEKGRSFFDWTAINSQT